MLHTHVACFSSVLHRLSWLCLASLFLLTDVRNSKMNVVKLECVRLVIGLLAFVKLECLKLACDLGA